MDEIDYNDEKYDDNWPKGSLEEFIWERCEFDNKRVREIMSRIGKHPHRVKALDEKDTCGNNSEEESEYPQPHHSQDVQGLVEALELACQYLKIDGDIQSTNAIYVPPAQALRNAADRHEQKERDIKKIRQILSAHKQSPTKITIANIKDGYNDIRDKLIKDKFPNFMARELEQGGFITKAGVNDEPLQPSGVSVEEIEQLIRDNGEYKERFTIGLMDMVDVHVKPLAQAIHAKLTERNV